MVKWALIVVALGFGDGPFLAGLAANPKLVIHGLVATDASLAAARGFLLQEGLHGRVSCDRFNGKDLPYIDNLVNVVLCESTVAVPEQEMMRVLAPGGLLMVKGTEGWQKTRSDKLH